MIQNKLALLMLLSLVACDGASTLGETDDAERSPSAPPATGGEAGTQPGPSVRCTLIGCGPSARLTLPALQWSFEQVKTLTVKACRNAVCVEGPLASLSGPAPEPGAGLGLSLPAATGPVAATLWSQAGGGYYAEVSWTEYDITLLQDGDVFEGTLVDSEGQIATSAAKTVSYRVVTPNGPSCSPTCKVDVDL